MDALMLAAADLCHFALKMSFFFIYHSIVSFIDDTFSSTATTELS